MTAEAVTATHTLMYSCFVSRVLYNNNITNILLLLYLERSQIQIDPSASGGQRAKRRVPEDCPVGVALHRSLQSGTHSTVHPVVRGGFFSIFSFFP